MPTFYLVSPEVAGGFGDNTKPDASSHPPEVSHLHFEFQGWLGDDLLTSFPCYLASQRLRDALEALALSTGFSFREAEISLDEQFRQFLPEVAQSLPRFWWLHVHGRAGVDDMGLAAPAKLVVSRRVLDVLEAHVLDNADVIEHAPEN